MPVVCTGIKGEVSVVGKQVYCQIVLHYSRILTGQAQRRPHVGCTAVPSVGRDHLPLNCQKNR